MDKRYFTNNYNKRDVTAAELADQLEYLGENGERDRGYFDPRSQPKFARTGAITGQAPGNLNTSRSSHQDWPRPSNTEWEESRRRPHPSDHSNYRPQAPLQQERETANVYNRNAPSDNSNFNQPQPQQREFANIDKWHGPLGVPGEPGSATFSDPLRKGMSGAATKWYKRFLLEGKSPEEARELALSRNVAAARSPKYPPRERERSGETTAEMQPKRARSLDSPGPSSRAPQKPRNQAPKSRNPPGATKPVDNDTVKGIHVGVVHEDFPHTLMPKETLEVLEDAIAGKIHLGWRTLIQLEGIFYQAGYFIVGCCDEDTVEWLEKVAVEVGEELAIPLKTLKGIELPRHTKMSVWLPKAHLMSEEETLRTIEGSNPVDTKTWKVIKCATAGPGRILVAKISPAEQEKLASQGFKLFFRFKRLDVHGLKGSVSPEAKPGKDEPNGGEEGEREMNPKYSN